MIDHSRPRGNRTHGRWLIHRLSGDVFYAEGGKHGPRSLSTRSRVFVCFRKFPARFARRCTQSIRTAPC